MIFFFGFNVAECTQATISEKLKQELLTGLRFASQCTYFLDSTNEMSQWSKKLLSDNRINIMKKGRAWAMEIYLAQLSFEGELGRKGTLKELVAKKHLPKPREELSYFFSLMPLGKPPVEFALQGRHFPVFGEFIHADENNLKALKEL